MGKNQQAAELEKELKELRTASKGKTVANTPVTVIKIGRNDPVLVAAVKNTKVLREISAYDLSCKVQVDLDKDNSNKYYVKSEENSICPVCGCCELKVIGSRKRNTLQGDGETIILIIRRLRCRNCRRIHHELPDILVPYNDIPAPLLKQ